MAAFKKNKTQRKFNEFGKQKDDYFDFDNIKEYFNHKDNSSCYQILSDKVCNDLDFFEVFKFIDRTNSKVGQQVLYDKLRTIPVGKSEASKNENVIDFFCSDRTSREEIQYLLKKLNDQESFYLISLFQNVHIKPPKWFFIARLLSFTMILSLLLLAVNVSFILLITCIYIVNLIIHYWNKRNLYQYIFSIPKLLVLNSVAKRLSYYTELKSITRNIEDSIKVIDKVRRRTYFFKIESNLQNDAAAILWGILELLKIAFLLEPIMLFSALKQLDNKKKEIENVYNFVGNVDMLFSIASLRKGVEKFCVPKITDKRRSIKAVNIYHPLIDDCVENSICTGEKSVLLTGSNMSGKTSFIRTIGINAICALTINTCFADEFELPKLRVFSAIRISDDLLNDKSYYFEEVLTIKEMVDKSNENSTNLFLLDEIFKGTNTVERISAGKAVLSSLSKNNSITFVSTHDIELADLLKDEYELFHFSEIVNNTSVAFDYKLKNGKLKNRNAIKILKLNNYPIEIIEEALRISKVMDKLHLQQTSSN